MITLHQFDSPWTLPNASPFCLKLETWLRMAEIPYETAAFNPMQAPTGKAPYIQHEGQFIGDSTVIIRHLVDAFDVQLDAGLTAQQRAQGLLMQRTLEEHTYWSVLLTRWNPPHWGSYKHVIGASLPAPVRPLMLPWLRSGVVKSTKAHGLGRHSPEEVARRAIADVDAVAALMGDYALGDRPSTTDATLYSFLAHAGHPDFDAPLQRHVAGHAQIQAYLSRMEARYWADWSPPGGSS